MKKFWTAVMAVSLAALLGGCGGNSGNANASDSTGESRTAASTTASTEKAEPVKLHLAAAASLEYAFQEKLIPLYQKEHPEVTIEGTYDSSGKLQTQIESGMETDLFFSAATKQMAALVTEDLIDKDTVTELLENKVVLITPTNDPEGLKAFTDIEKAKTIAIGDPESVPAGQYAKEVLTKLSLWDNLESRFSLGTNVTEVLNWVAEGSADAGIVYETDAKTTDKVKIIAEAPADSLEKPIIYPAGIVKASKNAEATKAFLAFLQTAEAADIFKEYGFTPIAN